MPGRASGRWGDAAVAAPALSSTSPPLQWRLSPALSSTSPPLHGVSSPAWQATAELQGCWSAVHAAAQWVLDASPRLLAVRPAAPAKLHLEAINPSQRIQDQDQINQSHLHAGTLYKHREGHSRPDSCVMWSPGLRVATAGLASLSSAIRWSCVTAPVTNSARCKRGQGVGGGPDLEHGNRCVHATAADSQRSASGVLLAGGKAHHFELSRETSAGGTIAVLGLVVAAAQQHYLFCRVWSWARARQGGNACRSAVSGTDRWFCWVPADNFAAGGVRR